MDGGSDLYRLPERKHTEGRGKVKPEKVTTGGLVVKVEAGLPLSNSRPPNERGTQEMMGKRQKGGEESRL